jgi:MoaA/NifB/PqqE/SkfB family radical SAM enzyme
MKPTKIVYGISESYFKFRVRLRIIKILLRNTWSPKKIVAILMRLNKMQKQNNNGKPSKKVIKHHSTYLWSIYAPPFPSKAFDRLLQSEISYALNPNNGVTPLNIIFLSITKKCPLNCQHCLEWDIMHRAETLALKDLKEIVKGFINKGISSIYFTGGEPMSRFKDLLELIHYASNDCQVWTYSSGYSLDFEKAKQMQKAGLTGVIVSIDHFKENNHNNFRGNDNSFKRATNAVENVRKAGLLTAVSVCVTREFITSESLHPYMDFAKQMGVAFVQMLEPVSLGKFKDQEVSLQESQLETLNSFIQKYNSSPSLLMYPPIAYQGYYQRKSGCHGGGKRFLYVDSDGNIQSCPFCNHKLGSVLNNDLEFEENVCDRFQISEI